MRKVLYTFLVTLALCTQANAYDVFIGGEAAQSWAQFKGPDGTYENDEITTYGVKAGVVDTKTRMYLSYKYMDAFEDSTTRTGEYQTFTANSEAFTDPQSIFNLFDLLFFVGGHAGAININVEASFGESDKLAFMYGAQAGIIADFDLPISLEAGYRFSFSTFNDNDTDLTKLQVAYGGINIRF